MLAAAETLFQAAKQPGSVTMEEIAAAAGVGKGTVFRAFGTREGLLDALWAAKGADLRARLEPAQAETTEAATLDTLLACLDALLVFKIANRHLVRAREGAPDLARSENYRWARRVLRTLLDRAAPRAPTDRVAYAAELMLAGLHVDPIEHLLEQGLTERALRDTQRFHAEAIVETLRQWPA